MGSVALKEINPGILKIDLYRKNNYRMFKAFSFCDDQSSLFDFKSNNSSFSPKVVELSKYNVSTNTQKEFSFSLVESESAYYTIPKLYFSKDKNKYNVQG